MNRRSLVLAAAAAACATTEPPGLTDTIFELRNYALHPGQREVLIELFEREFIESQEAAGAHIVGAFRDLDHADQFVWIRSYADMDARLAALTAFYTGPVWRTHRNAANATMIDADNVHLLHPIGAPLRLARPHPPIGAAASSAMFVVDSYLLAPRGERGLLARANRDPRVIAAFSTEQTPNNFPSLPVRDDVVFLTLRRFERIGPAPAIADMPAAAETLRLLATSRSLLR